MKENTNQPNKVDKIDNKEIDLLDLGKKIWIERALIIKTCCLAFIIGLLVAFSIPKEYTTSVTLTPESKEKNAAGGLGALASMAGINFSGGSGEEALSPELYPYIVNSTPFLLDLFPVRVTPFKQSKSISLSEYIENHQHYAWWHYISSAPISLLNWSKSLLKDNNISTPDKNINALRLTKEQEKTALEISKRIMISVDKKSGIISLSVSMQDPLISATVTDTIMRNLQNYITRYRTNKAMHDLEYTEKLYKEAQQEYYLAQQRYANFADSNLDIVMSGYRTKLERLQNEATLAYGLYNQISQQLQLAKAKVQEVTPVYTVIQPATVPLQASAPNKPMILIGFIFLALVSTTMWILFVKEKK